MKMKDGTLTVDPKNHETKVILKEDGVVVAETYVVDTAAGLKIIEGWQNGSYQLLID
jgi:hypothetical protein